MIRIPCVDCGKVGRFQRQPRRSDVRCPGCKELASGILDGVTPELRGYLLSYPVALKEIERFHRVLLGQESWTAYCRDVFDDRAVHHLVQLELFAQTSELEPEQVERRLREALAEGVLPSASLHRTLASLADAQGLELRYLREGRVADFLVRRIYESAQGTEQDPWQVIDVSDELLVLERAGKRSLERYLIEQDGRYYDLHECDDGSEAWFDVTPQVVARQRRKLKKSRAARAG
ncbi:MAG: hypothetical protein R3F62_24555 [Planctomycetota bacterium]